MKSLKADVGDYVRTESGMQQVVRVDGSAGDPLAGYELANGSLIADVELSDDDVLLASEVEELQ